MIEVTLDDGKKAWINVQNILLIEMRASGSAIYFGTGISRMVKDDTATLIAKIDTRLR